VRSTTRMFSTLISLIRQGSRELAGPAGSNTARPVSVMGHLVFVDSPRRPDRSQYELVGRTAFSATFRRPEFP
jgi:hypothetical protein